MAVSAASGQSAVAPDSLLTLYGTEFIAGSRVEIKDGSNSMRSASVLFASHTQINFLLPAATALGAARIAVVKPDGNTSQTTVVPVQRAAPALFSASANGHGPAAALAVRVERNGTQTLCRFSGNRRVGVLRKLVFRPLGGDFSRHGVFRSDMVWERARSMAFRAPDHRLDEPTRLSLGMVASLQSPLPFYLASSL